MPYFRPPYWSFNIKEGCALETNSSDACSLYIAFCKPVESKQIYQKFFYISKFLNPNFLDTIDCNGAGSCLRYPNQPGSTVVVGNYTADPFNSFGKFKQKCMLT